MDQSGSEFLVDRERLIKGRKESPAFCSTSLADQDGLRAVFFSLFLALTYAPLKMDLDESLANSDLFASLN